MQIPTDFESISQHGEDLAILGLLPENCIRWVVDIGANDGRSWSNSYAFGLMGFELLLVEPMKVYAKRCRRLWRDNDRVRVEETAISHTEGVVDFYINNDAESDALAMRSSLQPDMVPGHDVTRVSVKSLPLHKLLEKHRVPPKFALLSIDAEGFDLQVLRTAALDRYRPNVICVEDEADVRDVRSYLASMDYVEVNRLGPNGVYMRAGIAKGTAAPIV